eukprot:Rmarinus@m.29283
MSARIGIVYYSMYGHVLKLAEAMKAAVEETGATCTLFQVAETLPGEVLEKMHAAPKADHPACTPDDLKALDGILFGFPSRFGMMPAQMKAFFDSTGGLWQSGGLVGKMAGVFFSSGTQGGGQETVALTTLTQFTHHGMIFVPIGYSCPALLDMNEMHGGSPYGAGTLAGGDGSRQPSDLELKVARHQGKYFADTVNAYTRGKAASA